MMWPVRRVFVVIGFVEPVHPRDRLKEGALAQAAAADVEHGVAGCASKPVRSLETTIRISGPLGPLKSVTTCWL